jgi:hypothetical protein
MANTDWRLAVSSLIENPALDAATVNTLKSVDVTYLSTRWNAFFGDWEHYLEYTPPRGNGGTRQLIKTDAGIHALLEALW